jgi:Domain of unknown function (DUF1877)
MACRGLFIAITDEELEELQTIEDEDERVEFTTAVLEERYFGTPNACETDKAWDAMHRCFNDTAQVFDASAPLNVTVLGGQPLSAGPNYIIVAKTPLQVRAVAEALDGIDQSEFRARYSRIDQDQYEHPLSDEDFEYTWQWFEDVRRFYQHVATTGRPVLFAVDQ